MKASTKIGIALAAAAGAVVLVRAGLAQALYLMARETLAPPNPKIVTLPKKEAT